MSIGRGSRPCRALALVGILHLACVTTVDAQDAAAVATFDRDGRGPIILDCRREVDGYCSFQAPQRAVVRAYSVRTPDDSESVGGDFLSFDDAPFDNIRHDELSLVLVDVTSGLANGRIPTTAATLELAGAVARAFDSTGRVAVGTFGARFDLLTGPAAPVADRDAALAALEFSEVQTLFYSSIGEAIAWLRDQPATVRRLVVLSDGLPEDDRRQHEAGVVEAARDANVQISAIVLYWHPGGDPQTATGRDVMSALAVQTNGVWTDAFARTEPIDPEPLTSALLAQRANSGYVLPYTRPSDLRIMVRAELPRVGDTDTLVDRRFVAQLPLPPPRVVAPPPPPPDLLWPWIAGAAGGLALAALGLLLMARRRRLASRVSSLGGLGAGAFPDAEGAEAIGCAEDGTATRASGGIAGGLDLERPVLARLRRADGEDPPYEIRSHRVSIGRGPDNDLIIAHDSVSRVHCEVHWTREGVFAVTDLGSLNGIRVNGEAVASSRLDDGAELQLGEVALHFVYAGAKQPKV